MVPLYYTGLTHDHLGGGFRTGPGFAQKESVGPTPSLAPLASPPHESVAKLGIRSLLKLRTELKASDIPLLASPQGGVAASSRKFCEATEADAAGVVFLFVLNRKTTPSARSVDASRHFLTRAATPPCGDARSSLCRKEASLGTGSE